MMTHFQLPQSMRGRRAPVLMLTAFAFVVSGCENTELPAFLQPKPNETATDSSAGAVLATTERDVEAPDVFEAREDGLWDGRPSLGGVWVAHPNVKEPERVIIRSAANGQFVIGALFRKERDTPGPSLQVSSDAAAALGMLAGQPTKLHVVALRREEAPAEVPAALEDPAPLPAEGALEAPSEIDAAPLDPVDPVAAAAEAALAEPGASAPAPTPAPAPPPAPAQPASSLAKPFIQIGIFSVETNAQNTATAMRQRGLIPTVKKQTSQGKTFWRVVVGPARNSTELKVLLQKTKDAGFADAYAVTN